MGWRESLTDDMLDMLNEQVPRLVSQALENISDEELIDLLMKRRPDQIIRARRK